MDNHGLLKQIGLNEKEIRVYLFLLRMKKAKPATIAASTKINRTLVYNIAKDLISKGLIAEDVSGKLKYLVPRSPKSLGSLIDHARRELKEKEILVQKAIESLNLISSEVEYPVPRIQLIEEKDIERFLFNNLTKWQDKILNSDNTWWGFQNHTFVERYDKWIKNTWETEQSKHESYTTKIFTNASLAEKKLDKKYKKRNVRFLSDANFTATTWVCGDYFIIIQTQEHPYYLIEIHDHLLASNSAEIFKVLWEKTQ